MLEILAVPLIAGGLVASSCWAIYRHNRGRLEGWKYAAESCGLRVVETSGALVWRARTRAKEGPVEVRIEESKQSHYSLRVKLTAPGPPGFVGLRLRRELYKLPKAREIEIGDESFDSEFYIEGPMRLALALFDAETRRRLKELNRLGEPEIVGGEYRLEGFDQKLAAAVPLLLEISRSFAPPIDAVQRLTENALRDPVPGVRLLNLLFLIRELSDNPGTIETLRAACSDPSPEIRLRAAKALGAEGRDVLVTLAESVVEDGLSAQAVAILGRELSFERASAILGESLRRRRLETARACLESLGRGGNAEAVDALAKVMAREKGELAAAAARALGETGDPDAEPPLLQALQREKADLQVAAASALGRVGSAASVPALKEAAEGILTSELRRAARQAIAEIQARLPGASPGQLSLAGEEEGRLSIAEAEAGQLSLTTDPGGQLSLNDPG